ncbi:MAG TPA: AsmA-like C-terminal region-containing protein [Rhodopila sp.]|jgi:uncharacterized protein involved in outer membrane biogenesis|nr:AsmA-like C-terminal region-containing protein [Rhodopila sp.]
MTRRRIAICGLGLVALVVVIIATALVTFGRFNLAPAAARYASHALGRSVTIGALHVHWGAVVTVKLRDLTLANTPGGSQRDMARITRVDAQIAPVSLIAWMLWHRPPVIRQLTIDGARLLLEHAGGDRGNWRFRGSKPATRKNPRSGFPTLLDAHLQDAEIDLRGSGGDTIRIRLDTAGIVARAADQPVTLTATGAYNGTPLTLSANLHSYNELHNASRPFGTAIVLSSADTRLAFTGTMTDPINVDGAVGKLTLTAPNLDRLLAIAGIGDRAALPVELAGDLTRQGDLWHLSHAQGTLTAHPLQLDFILREGARRAPDAMTVDANFSTLDLTALGTGGPPSAMSMRIDDQPGNLIDAHVTAKQFDYGALRADDADLRLHVAPGALTVQHLDFHLIGGAAQITAAVNNTRSGAGLRFDAALAGADTGQLARTLGIAAMPVSGAFDAHADMRLTGTTLQEAAPVGTGTVILSMRGGAIQRQALERVSTDLRQLFGKPEGTARIVCALGVLQLQNGTGRLAPLRLRTADGTVAAAGTIDLRREAVDLTIATEAGLLALDVPLRVTGPIRSPHVSPALGTAAATTRAAPDLRAMPSALQQIVRDDPCLTPGR